MNLRILITLPVLLFFVSCVSYENSTNYESSANTVHISNEYSLVEISTDSTYGYVDSNPILTGYGPRGERYYLNQLLGPNGQSIEYIRLGSTIPEEYDDSDEFVILDVYEVIYEGIEEPVYLYLNMYEFDNPKAPLGFSHK